MSTENNCQITGEVDWGEGPVEIRCTKIGKHKRHRCEVFLGEEPEHDSNGEKASTERIPEVGDYLMSKDVDMIFEAVGARQVNFPGEPSVMSFALVLMNIGDRFTPVTCVNGEWEGLKKDIPKRTDGGIPLCPNGHVMTEGIGLRIGWVQGD